MTTPRLYLLTEVAEMTGLSARGLADAARAGKLVTHKIQGRHFMSESQIQAYLDSTVVGAVQAATSPLSNDEAWARFQASRKKRKARVSRKSDT